MQYPENRLASFSSATTSALSKPKSRLKLASSSKATSSTSQIISWPLSPSKYPYLTPENLCNAGYYYSPSAPDDLDQCACFLCGKKLGGWGPNDDPFEEHWRRMECGWGVAVCGVYVDEKKNGKKAGKARLIYEDAEALPSSQTMTDARLKTFGKKWWPHPQRGWLPTPIRLAEAGFVFTPTTQDKDCVTCIYCEYYVTSWEPKDDPYQIHKTKRPNCSFFNAQLAEQAEEQEDVVGTASKRRASPIKAKRTASRAKASTKPPAPTPSASTSLARSTTRRTTRKTAQPPSITGSEAETEPETATEAEPEPESAAPSEDEGLLQTAVKKLASPIKSRKGKGRATTTGAGVGVGRKKRGTTATAAQVEQESEVDDQQPTEPDAQPEEVVEELMEQQEEEPLKKSTARKGRATGAGKKSAAAVSRKGKGKAKAVIQDAGEDDQQGMEAGSQADGESIAGTDAEAHSVMTDNATEAESTVGQSQRDGDGDVNMEEVPVKPKKAKAPPKTRTKRKVKESTVGSPPPDASSSVASSEAEAEDPEPAPQPSVQAILKESKQTQKTSKIRQTASKAKPSSRSGKTAAVEGADLVPPKQEIEGSRSETDAVTEMEVEIEPKAEVAPSTAERDRLVIEGAEQARSVLETIDQTTPRPNAYSRRRAPNPPTQAITTTPQAPAPLPAAVTTTPQAPPPLPLPKPNAKPEVMEMKEDIALTDEQAEMTVIDYVRAMYGLKYKAMKEDGEAKIQEWEEKARTARAFIESIRCRDE